MHIGKKKVVSASPEEQELERRVDDMMSLERPGHVVRPIKGKDKKEVTAQPATTAVPVTTPPLDIFEGLPPSGDVTPQPGTAPDLPTRLAAATAAKGNEAKKVAVSQAPSEPELVATTVAPAVADLEPAPSPAPAATPPEPEPVPEPTPAKLPPLPKVAELDNPATDKAVDDIVARESDELLAAEDAAAAAAAPVVPTKTHGGWKQRFGTFFKSKWTWIGVGVIVVAVFAVPVTRYWLLGLVIKEPVTVSVIDSKTDTPVSTATVSVAGRTAKTNASGKATIKVPLGKQQFTVSKQYYKSGSQSTTVGFSGTKALSIQLVATGRQVPLTVINKISGKPLAGANIIILNTSARTNAKGQATVVLPASAATDPAEVRLSGYNNAQATVTVTSSVVAGNTLSLTPSGKVYFLSNASGGISVMSSNLDGSNQQTVLASTGTEDPNNTYLLPSPDWHYLVLEAQRNSSQAGLYVINTSNDKVTEFDSANANYLLIGWSGDNFLYDATSNTTPASSAGHEVIRSYNAANGQLNLLDQNQVQVTDANDYASESFANFTLLHNELLYTAQWSTAGSASDSSDTDTIRGIEPNGQDKKDYLSQSTADFGYVQTAQYQPNAVYFSVYNYSTNQPTYYNFADGALNQDQSLSSQVFTQAYPAYFSSPSGNQTLWSAVRNGQETLLLGDQDGQNETTVNSPGGYSAYGWYGNNYLLVSQNNSQLYIMPVGGSQTPLKITNYYKQPSPLSVAAYGN